MEVEAPQYQAPPPDPNLKLLEDRAKAQDFEAAQARVQDETASLMARYGSRLAIAQATPGASNTVAPAASSTGVTAPMVTAAMPGFGNGGFAAAIAAGLNMVPGMKGA